jgi:hypothetical protein
VISSNLILFILVGIGITNLAVNATVLDYPRGFITKKSPWVGRLITCMMCFGFWVGIVLAFNFEINPVYGGAIISLLSYTFGTLIDYVELSTALKGRDFEDEYAEDG